MTRIPAALAVLLLALVAAAPAAALEKIDLWRNEGGPHLRGAAVSQRILDPEVDGENGILGPGPTGVIYRQRDFDALAKLGANLVVLSHPGLFREKPPYEVEPVAQENLDRQIAMAEKADLFVVIAFRSGPGRSPFTFHVDGTWFPPDRFNDTVWSDPAAQDAWAAMWRHTAERYRDRPAVVGYELMVEPNSSHVGSDARKGRLDIFDPARFHARHGGSLYDWNRLYPRILTAVRSVDPDTPVLIGGNGYSSVSFLEHVAPARDSRIVYVAHNYAPWRYTSQEPGGPLSYPGTFDADDDGRPERVDRHWVEAMYERVAAFGRSHGAPVAVAEFGVARWSPGAAAFLADSFAAMESRGLSSVLWHWPSSHGPYESRHNIHNYLYGADPANTVDLAGGAMREAIISAWGRNGMRPSTVRFERRGH